MVPPEPASQSQPQLRSRERRKGVLAALDLLCTVTVEALSASFGGVRMKNDRPDGPIHYSFQRGEGLVWGFDELPRSLVEILSEVRIRDGDLVKSPFDLQQHPATRATVTSAHAFSLCKCYHEPYYGLSASLPLLAVLPR